MRPAAGRPAMMPDRADGGSGPLRPVGFPEAVEALASWVGRPVVVRISDRRGVELTSIRGVLADQSTGTRVEFAVGDPDRAQTPLPLPLAEACGCALGEGRVRIATAGEVVVLLALEPRPPFPGGRGQVS